MDYFITVDAGTITGLYSDAVGYASVPSTAIAIQRADGEKLRMGFADFNYSNGLVTLNQVAILSKNKRAKTAEIDAAYTAAIAVISASYPETERTSWAKQEAEARAWTTSLAAPTPLLSAIATARGTTLVDICARVIANADAYALYAGGVIGKRQAKMITIAAATTVPELEAITW